MRTRRLIVAACVSLAAGCGVPTAEHPSTAAGDDVPYGLLEVGQGTTTTLPELAGAASTIWLVVGEEIVPVTREVAAPATLARAFEALATAATDAEARLGLRSAVPADAVNDVSVSAGEAIVDVSEQFALAAPREQLLALAQLVYTATEIGGVKAVRFTLDGQPIAVPRGDGSISEGPVTRLDYAAFEG